MIVLPIRRGAPVHPDQPTGRLIIPLIRAVASFHPGSEGGEAEITSWRGRLRPFLLTRYQVGNTEALGAIFTGAAGGPMAHFAPLIGNTLGVSKVPITYLGLRGRQ
jgi:hypothetical protein